MASIVDFPAGGKVIAVKDGMIVFAPRGTTYALHLQPGTAYEGPLNTPVEALIRVRARKLWTVPSGGNFVTPIVGPPRIVQGPVRFADDRHLVVAAGTNFIVELPSADSAIDLNDGPIALNEMVNVTLYPEAQFELVKVKGGSAVETVATASAVAGD